MATIWRSSAGQRACTLGPPLAQGGEQVRDGGEALLELLGRLVAAHLEVLLDGQRGEHVVALRDEAHALGDQLVGLEPGDVLPAQGDAALADLDEAEHGLEQRRLPAPLGR
jgi:hypothetical protein